MNAYLLNVVQVAFAFLLIFAALNSSSFIGETVINEIAATTGRVDRHDGYVSSSIIYLFFTFAAFIAPPVISMLGTKWSMALSSTAYAIYQCSFLYLHRVLLYISSALLGIGAAVLWTAQGKYMCLNSNNETAGRHSGIFWAISQACIIFGGIFMFVIFYWNDSQEISPSTLYIIYGVFTALSVVGVIMITLLRVPSTMDYSLDTTNRSQESIDKTLNSSEDVSNDTNIITFKKQLRTISATIKLASTRRMAFAILAFSYTGLVLSFWSGVYPTCIASTLRLGFNTKCLLALNAITQGCGQAVSGLLFGILSSKTKWLGRYRILGLGAVVHTIVFIGIYINIPNEAPLGKTEAIGVIEPSILLALICGFALGFGDACWNTQIYAFLIARYQKESAEAFCLFRFFHSLLTAIAFYYSKLLTLPWHLAILTIGGAIGAFGFYMADGRVSEVEEKIN